MVLDPVKEFKAKDEHDLDQAGKFLEMEDMIRSSEEKFLSLEHNGKTIRIRFAVPGKSQMDVIRLVKKYKGVDLEALRRGQMDLSKIPDGVLEESLAQLYESLAAICLDAPYNAAAAWQYFDNKTGEAQTVYELALGLMKEAHDTAISFRKKP